MENNLLQFDYTMFRTENISVTEYVEINIVGPFVAENSKEYISALVDSGLSIIPITEGKKNPHFACLDENHEHNLLTVPPTQEDIKKWVNAGVKSWATAGGVVSRNLMILDFDAKHYPELYNLWYAKLSDEQKKVVNTCHRSKTRNNGDHLRYRTETPQATIKLAGRAEFNEAEGKYKVVTTAETRGDKSYALIPPSAGYATIHGSLLDLPVIPDKIHQELIEILKSFNEVVEKPATEYELKPNDTITGDRPGDRLNQKATWNEILEPHDWREVTKNHWCRPGKNGGISATTDYNNISMLYVFSSSASPFEPNTGYSKFHAFALLNHDGDFKAAAKVAAEMYPIDYEAESRAGNFKAIFPGKTQKVSYMIAQYLVGKYHVKTIGERVRDIHIYDNGIYVLGLNLLKAEIQDILQELASTHHKNNIVEMIKDLTLADRKDFDVENHLINLNNGVFDIRDKTLTPHSHEHLFFTKIPVDYNPNATCPAVTKFLGEILPEAHVKIILEWFGYCLYRRYFIKKAIIFVGERDTGKSTLIKLYERFTGKENTSGVSLQKIASDKFASSHLYNKHINIYDDLSFKDINDNGLFKIATGGSVMTGEKKFGEQFQFENFSKLTFACNKIPDVKDTTDDAYFSRWIIIPFLAVIAEKEIDKFLTDKITTKKELSGLLNLALSGLSDILQTQNFSYDKTPEEIKKEMLLSGSMVANFVKDCLVEEVDAWVSKDDMYEECAKYTMANNLPTISKEVLGRKLPNHSGYIIDSSKTVGSKQVRGWRNVKIK